MWIELACEYLVGMSWNNLVTDLLYTNHTRLIVDLNVGLRSGHTKTASVTRIVDCVELVFLVEHDMFNVVALRGVALCCAALLMDIILA